MILAALKLRQRNLGPILDANGWAVNGRVKINIPFGGALTKTARLPKGSVRLLKDPYAATSKATKIVFWAILLALLAAARNELYPVDERDHVPLVAACRNPAQSGTRRRHQRASADRSGAQSHGASPVGRAPDQRPRFDIRPEPVVFARSGGSGGVRRYLYALTRSCCPFVLRTQDSKGGHTANERFAGSVTQSAIALPTLQSCDGSSQSSGES